MKDGTPQVKWLIENFEADNKMWKLINEVKSRGQTIEIIDYYKYSITNSITDDSGMPTKSSYSDDDCVVVMGSIQLAMWVNKNKPWVPGVWLDPDKFKCTTFYSYLGKFLFNQDYEFTTIGEYKRKKDLYFDKYGIQDCLFIRPNSGLKSFSGQIFKKENHVTDWAYFNMSTNESDIIVVSSPKTIQCEWRFVVGGGKIVASSLYRRNDEMEQLPGAPKEAHQLVEEIMKVADKELIVAPMYVIDICKGYDEKYYLMELNCFTCAGMYECDKALIVDAVVETAIREWKSYQEDIM